MFFKKRKCQFFRLLDMIYVYLILHENDRSKKSIM